MKIKAAFVGLLKEGLCAEFAYSHYIPKTKRLNKLLRKHPKASNDLWVEAFNSGMDFQKGLILREEDGD